MAGKGKESKRDKATEIRCCLLARWASDFGRVVRAVPTTGGASHGHGGFRPPCIMALHSTSYAGCMCMYSVCVLPALLGVLASMPHQPPCRVAAASRRASSPAWSTARPVRWQWRRCVFRASASANAVLRIYDVRSDVRSGQTPAVHAGAGLGARSFLAPAPEPSTRRRCNAG